MWDERANDMKGFFVCLSPEIQFILLTALVVLVEGGGHEGRFSKDPLPAFPTGCHCERVCRDVHRLMSPEVPVLLLPDFILRLSTFLSRFSNF